MVKAGPLHCVVLGLLRHGAMLNVDELADRLGVPADDVAQVLADLEREGLIRPATAQ